MHETALASPEVTDLGGLVVVPGFTDSHVHFPTWALAQNEVNLDGCANARRGARADQKASTCDPVVGFAATAGAAATGSHSAIRPVRTLDAITGDTPAGLIAKDYHSLWLNSAALALADGDLEVEGGVVERDASGEPTGHPARGGRLAFQGTAHDRLRRRLPRRDARRRAAGELARRHRRARQGRLARSAASVATARGARPADAARLAVDPRTTRSTPPSPSGCAPDSAART